jgi:hypothetical protein
VNANHNGGEGNMHILYVKNTWENMLYQKSEFTHEPWHYKIMEMEILFTRPYIYHLTFKHINILTLI